jgi:hypothetical protein
VSISSGYCCSNIETTGQVHQLGDVYGGGRPATATGQRARTRTRTAWAHSIVRRRPGYWAGWWRNWRLRSRLFIRS